MLQAQYEVIDESVWKAKQPCLYLVGASDSTIMYVGISRNGLKHRWSIFSVRCADWFKTANQAIISQPVLEAH